MHGVYKPGNVKLRPAILKEAQEAVAEKHGLAAGAEPFDLVFHGGSGSSLEEIPEAVSYGVVKMNVDTDTQYAFTRPVVDHMLSNYSGVLKIDGEVGDKKAYDPRAWGKAAEAGMAARVSTPARTSSRRAPRSAPDDHLTRRAGVSPAAPSAPPPPAADPPPARARAAADPPLTRR